MSTQQPHKIETTETKVQILTFFPEASEKGELKIKNQSIIRAVIGVIETMENDGRQSMVIKMLQTLLPEFQK